MRRSIKGIRRIALLVLALASGAATLRAQGQQVRALPPAGAGIIAGVVTDTSGRSISGASVFLSDRTREVRTGPDGIFRFNGVKTSDTLTIVARRVGFFPLSARVPIGPDGRQVMIQLRDRPTSLPAVVTQATVSGLVGLVTDTSATPLPGASIQAIGGTQGEIRADSAGRFAMSLKPGQYMLRVTGRGHIAQMVGVTIPPNGGRNVAVQLTPGRDGYQTREAAYAWDLKERLVLRSSVWSKVYSREDLAKMGDRDLRTVASLAANGPMDPDCEVTVNGNPLSRVPLWSLDVEELEMLEVYSRTPTSGVSGGGRPRGVTSLNGARGISTQSAARRGGTSSGMSGGRCSATVYAWTAK